MIVSGRPMGPCVHVCPPFTDCSTPTSVPTMKMFEFGICSPTCTGMLGRLSPIPKKNVCPPSRVSVARGALSVEAVAITWFTSAGSITMRVKLRVTPNTRRNQVAPASRDTASTPSLVPAQITRESVDATASALMNPDPRVMSSTITCQLSPSFVVRYSRWVPKYSVDPDTGSITSGRGIPALSWKTMPSERDASFTPRLCRNTKLLNECVTHTVDGSRRSNTVKPPSPSSERLLHTDEPV